MALEMNIFHYLARSTSKQYTDIMYRASGLKLFLCCHRDHHGGLFRDSDGKVCRDDPLDTAALSVARRGAVTPTNIKGLIWKVGICYITYISSYVPPLLRNKTMQHI